MSIYLCFSIFFFFLPCLFLLFSLLYSSIDTLVSCFLFCVLLSFVFNWWEHFWFHLLAGSLSCTLFSLDAFGFMCVCVHSSIFVSICLIMLLSFVASFCLLLCLFVLTPFITIAQRLRGLASLIRSWAWASRAGLLSPGLWTIREFLTPGSIRQWELPQRSPLKSNIQYCSSACSTQCWMLHPNNKQDRNIHQIITDRMQVTQKHTTSHDLSHQWEKAHLLPPEYRHRSLPTQSWQYPLDQYYSLGTETKGKNCDPIAWGMETTNTVSWTKWTDREILCRWRNKEKTHKTKWTKRKQANYSEK